jgi:hypothetical protein
MTTEHTQVPSSGASVPREDRPIGELFSELANETSTLVRQEIDLATTELTSKATYAGKQASLVAAGAALGLVGLLALVAALVLGLGTVMALWVSALLVGLAISAIAAAVAVKGIGALRRMNLKPEHTMESLQENKSWVQRQIR